MVGSHINHVSIIIQLIKFIWQLTDVDFVDSQILNRKWAALFSQGNKFTTSGNYLDLAGVVLSCKILQTLFARQVIHFALVPKTVSIHKNGFARHVNSSSFWCGRHSYASQEGKFWLELKFKHRSTFAVSFISSMLLFSLMSWLEKNRHTMLTFLTVLSTWLSFEWCGNMM